MARHFNKFKRNIGNDIKKTALLKSDLALVNKVIEKDQENGSLISLKKGRHVALVQKRNVQRGIPLKSLVRMMFRNYISDGDNLLPIPKNAIAEMDKAIIENSHTPPKNEYDW